MTDTDDDRHGHGTGQERTGVRACRVVTTEASARILLAAQLREIGEYDWTVVCGDRPLDVPPDGVRYVEIPMRREPALSDALAALALYRFFRSNRFAFVQTHTPKASLLGLPAARLAGQRALYTMHGALVFRGNGLLSNVVGWLFERWCCAWAHAVLMQSAEDAERVPRLRACAPTKVRYIGNGVDIRRFSRRRGPDDDPDAPPVVLMVSRLVAEKGCMDFFELAERLKGSAQFVHVGPTEADQADAVPADVVDDLRSRSVVRFVGEVRDVRPHLDAADVFVLPSYREGIPRAAMEAALRELPVVAYDIRGVREVVPPGLGLLVRRGDVDALTRATERMLADRRARVLAGRACRQHVDANFSESAVIERLREAYSGMQRVPRGARPCFTVDVEDFSEGAAVLGLTSVRSRSSEVGLAAIERLLDRVASSRAASDSPRLTFFVVGAHAPAFRATLQRLLAAGHEIASHGPDHGRLPESAAALAGWMRKGREQLEDLFGVPVKGFRAPRFERPRALSPEAYRACVADAGFAYASDTLHVGHGPVHELPVWKVGPVPLGGGSYQRALPGWVADSLLRRNRSGGPPVLYYHSYDFGDEVTLERMPRSLLEARLVIGRRRAAVLFERLLSRFGSETCAGSLGLADR